MAEALINYGLVTQIIIELDFSVKTKNHNNLNLTEKSLCFRISNRLTKTISVDRFFITEKLTAPHQTKQSQARNPPQVSVFNKAPISRRPEAPPCCFPPGNGARSALYRKQSVASGRRL